MGGFAEILMSTLSTAISHLLHRPSSPTDIFAPVSTPAKSIFDLSLFFLGITGGMCVIVAALLAYAAIRFRKRKRDHGGEHDQVYGSLPVELAWTLPPVLISVLLFLATARVIFQHQHTT